MVLIVSSVSFVENSCFKCSSHTAPSSAAGVLLPFFAAAAFVTRCCRCAVLTQGGRCLTAPADMAGLGPSWRCMIIYDRPSESICHNSQVLLWSFTANCALQKPIW